MSDEYKKEIKDEVKKVHNSKFAKKQKEQQEDTTRKVQDSGTGSKRSRKSKEK